MAVIFALLVALAAVAGLWLVFIAVLLAMGRGGQAKALGRLVPDLLVLFRRLLGDPRVPRRSKLALGLVLAYVALPFDLVPDFIPVVGALDDAVLVGLALRLTLGGAGPELLTELWAGPPDTLRLLLAVTGERRLAPGRSWWLTLLLAVVAPLAVFAVLAEDVVEKEGFDQDAAILRFMERHQSPHTTEIMRLVSDFGWAPATAVVVLAVGTLLLTARLPRRAVFLAATSALAGAFNPLLKTVFDRPRPGLFPHLANAGGYAFPSGHAAISMTLATAVTAVFWRSRGRWPVAVAAGLYALAVGASRVYLGVHFPSDVVGAWALSLAWVGLVWLAAGGRLDRPLRW